MELRHLRYFVAVGELLHFGRAAARLRIAQPSLSHQIRQLEAELQTPLLLRTNRRVLLTGPGRLFLEEARQILAHADRAAVVARRGAGGEIRRLRIGFAYWMDLVTVRAIVKRLDEREPALHVELRSMSVPLQIVALREGTLDVGFVRAPVDEPSLGSEPVARDQPFVVALPHHHRLAASRRVPLSGLADEPFILFPREAVPVFYDLALEMCRQAGFVPRVRHEADQLQLVLELVAAGIGLSLVPASARRSPQPGVVFRPLRPSPRVLQMAVAWRRDNASPVLATFLQVVREHAASGVKA